MDLRERLRPVSGDAAGAHEMKRLIAAAMERARWASRPRCCSLLELRDDRQSDRVGQEREAGRRHLLVAHP